MPKKPQQLINNNSDHEADNSLHRRIKDNVEPKDTTHTMNLERRVKDNERRHKNIWNYNGPARRFNIDRRTNNMERRN